MCTPGPCNESCRKQSQAPLDGGNKTVLPARTTSPELLKASHYINKKILEIDAASKVTVDLLGKPENENLYKKVITELWNPDSGSIKDLRPAGHNTSKSPPSLIQVLPETFQDTQNRSQDLITRGSFSTKDPTEIKRQLKEFLLNPENLSKVADFARNIQELTGFTEVEKTKLKNQAYALIAMVKSNTWPVGENIAKWGEILKTIMGKGGQIQAQFKDRGFVRNVFGLYESKPKTIPEETDNRTESSSVVTNQSFSIENIPNKVKLRGENGPINGYIIHETQGRTKEGAFGIFKKKGTGCHYLVEHGNIYCLADPSNLVWHAAHNGKGRVGIEIVGDHRAGEVGKISAQDQAAVAWLVADIESRLPPPSNGIARFIARHDELYRNNHTDCHTDINIEAIAFSANLSLFHDRQNKIVATNDSAIQRGGPKLNIPTEKKSADTSTLISFPWLDNPSRRAITLTATNENVIAHEWGSKALMEKANGISYNRGEHWLNFGSMQGIYHSVDSPAMKKALGNSMIDFAIFAKSRGATVPAYLSYESDGKTPVRWCPWNSHDDLRRTVEKFKNNPSSSDPKVVTYSELKKFYDSTKELQKEFPEYRLRKELPEILAKADSLGTGDVVRANLTRMLDSQKGTAVLLEYINFKGPGIGNAEPWGMYYVLAGMQKDGDAVRSFGIKGKKLLQEHPNVAARPGLVDRIQDMTGIN